MPSLQAKIKAHCRSRCLGQHLSPVLYPILAILCKMDEHSSSAEPTPLMDDKGVYGARSTTPTPPALPPRPDKRALLLIYIHGFKGNETSFIEFPTVWSQKYNANKTRISKSRCARN